LRDPYALPAFRKEKQLGAYLFAGSDGRKPISSMTMLMFLKKLNRDAEGRPIWCDPRDKRPIVPHGGVRFLSSAQVRNVARKPRAVMEEALGHQVGSAVERAYRRTDVLEKRRMLMAEWAMHCGAWGSLSFTLGPSRLRRGWHRNAC
jgi:integrase